MQYLDQATWILPDTTDPFMKWLADQVAYLSMALCGRKALLLTNPSAEQKGCVVSVGCPENSRHVAAAVESGIVKLGDEEEFAIVSDDASSTLYIIGTDPAGAAYGLFAFFESLGCRFEISGDRLPAVGSEIPISNIDIRGRTANTWRGFYFQYCFATNSAMSIADYEDMFDQMAKMKLNTICYYFFPNEPFLDFTFRGERKLVGDISHPDSGYISYGRHFSGSYRVVDIPIGGELYGRDRVAPMEFQDVRSSSVALDTGKLFLNRLIALAKARGIKTWISFLPTFVPPNFAKYLKPMPRPHLHWSALASATDPVLDEINRARIKSILLDYPGLGGVFCGIPEGYFEDPYPESQALINERYPEFSDAHDIHRRLWGGYWDNDEELLESHIKRDICFSEIVSRTLHMAREMDAGIGLGVMTVCKAYLAGYLDSHLPKDVVFADIESRSLWTKDGAPLYLFRDIKDRECVIIPRAVDDGSMAGLQFNAGLYAKDRYIQSAAENNTNGLLIQLTHIRGNEHNAGFLSTGMWDDSLTPERYYADYASAILSTEAGKLEEVFLLLDEAEINLGGRGGSNMPWNKVPMQIEVLRSFQSHKAPFSSVPYHAGFLNTCGQRAELYGAAIGVLDRSLTILSTLQPGSEREIIEISYFKNRSLGYREHLQVLVDLSEIYQKLYEAYTQLPGNIDGFSVEIGSILQMCREAENHAALSAKFFAEAVSHPTDLGVLWMINSSMVIGTEVLRRYVRNVESYYLGREYWNDVGFERLFGSCPFPAYGDLAVAPEISEVEPG